MLMMAAGVIIIPGIDAIAKYLSDALAPGQIAASRFLFQLIFSCCRWFWSQGRPLRSRAISGLNAIRGALIGARDALLLLGDFAYHAACRHHRDLFRRAADPHIACGRVLEGAASAGAG